MSRGDRWQVGLLALVLLALLTACTSNPGAVEPELASCDRLAAGDPIAGEDLFRRTLHVTGGRAPTCISCHAVDAGEPEIVGPGLIGIVGTAEARSNAQTAEEYLCASIVAPNDYIVSGYNAGIMPRTYSFYLSQQQVNDMVAYLMTLE